MGVEYTTTGIKITDSSGEAVVDGIGLVGTTSFQHNYVEQGTEQSTTSTTFVDIPGVSLTTPNFSRDTNVLFLYTALLYAEDTDYPWVVATLKVDETQYRPWLIMQEGQTSAVDEIQAQISAFKFLTLGTGTHTAKLQFKVGTGATGYADQIILAYIQMGK